jgi:hypothetical protein
MKIRKPRAIQAAYSGQCSEMTNSFKARIDDEIHPLLGRGAIVFGRWLNANSARHLAKWLLRFADWADEQRST